MFIYNILQNEKQKQLGQNNLDFTRWLSSQIQFKIFNLFQINFNTLVKFQINFNTVIQKSDCIAETAGSVQLSSTKSLTFLII